MEPTPFVEHLLADLGWDPRADVIRGDGSGSDRPEFVVGIGGAGSRRFVVETRGTGGEQVAWQVRRIGWSAAVPLAIYTDGRVVHVYDTRRRPDVADRPSLGRLLAFDCRTLTSRMRTLAAVFSREAVRNGALERYAASAKRGKSVLVPVDQALAADIVAWREELAAAGVGEADAPKLVDQLVFDRICEARGIRRQGPDAGPAIRGIRARLDDPHSPYAFGAIGPDLLGSVYERLLGASRKAGGVFYTPAHIVQFIVEQTLGRALDGRSVEDAAALRVVDPSCGAGSFLVAAADYLLRWHLAQYRQNPGEWPGRVIRDAAGEWHLAASERQRIVLQTVHGVDLDGQAVAVARRALWLTVLDGAANAPAGLEALEVPIDTSESLAANIVAGNSLIDSQFNWQAAFPAVFAAGGFDAIIGNPPYLNLKRGFLSAAELAHFARTYRTARGQYDAFGLFTERALDLLRPDGRLGFILPKPVLINENYEPVREVLLEHTVEHIVACGRPFEDADVEATTLVVRARRAADSAVVCRSRIDGPRETEPLGTVSQGTLRRAPFRGLSYLLDDPGAATIATALAGTVPLSDLVAVFRRGIEAGKKALARASANGSANGASHTHKPTLRGEDVTAWRIAHDGLTFAATPANRRKWKSAALYEVPEKLLIRRVADRPTAAVDTRGLWVMNTLYVLHPADGVPCAFLAACLNSRLIAWIARVLFLTDDALFPYLRQSQLAQLPIPDPRRMEGSQVDRIVNLATGLAGLAATADAGLAAATRKLQARLETAVARAYGVDDTMLAALPS